MTEEARTLDSYFVDWEKDTFGFGYGTGEEHTLRALKDFFNYLEDGRKYNYQKMEAALGPTVAWLMINILCRADIFEYGTSPRNAWLTPQGERLFDYLKDKTVPALETLINESEAPYCGRSYCNCEYQPEPIGCLKNPFFFE